MIIDIVGAGSLGLLYGGKLRLAGNLVRFWTRTTDQAELLSREGIRILEQVDEVHLLPDQIEARPISEFAETWKSTPGTWLLLMIKQTSVDEFIHEIRQLTGNKLNMACFQNGMGHLEKLQAALPLSLVCSAITTEGAARTRSQVSRAGEGETRLGWKNIDMDASSSEEEHILMLSGLLQQAGFACTVSNEIDKLIYRKLLINAVINPLTAIWRITNGELIVKEGRMRLMRQLYDEAMGVYSATGIRLDQDMWEQLLEVCRATGSNTSSMLADVLLGQATEVGSINGHIVRMAHKVGLTASTHEMLLHLIEGISQEGVT